MNERFVHVGSGFGEGACLDEDARSDSSYVAGADGATVLMVPRASFCELFGEQRSLIAALQIKLSSSSPGSPSGAPAKSAWVLLVHMHIRPHTLRVACAILRRKRTISRLHYLAKHSLLASRGRKGCNSE